ncbi:45816e37-f0e1-448b-9c52-c339576b81e8 [Thermothielavioides terrestris]|uniref:45816e37-f0e1-448b-9c52-c339576b81e8 n=1 Tax=Thermothielavioides terrestris TaxID=2587410 RepID=A0A3S4F4P3_9PEZI|nr:45816e37-f0e1-448b-9c52-c339576b81e8 [Thermothielavioides terrestris]
MPLPDNQQDIRLMVAEEIEYLLSGEDFKAKAVDEIVARSQGNFLWASLVTKQVVKCHREDEVRRVLESTPDGMHGLYDRMMDAIKNLETDKDKALAKKLLTWAMYAKTPVTVEELAEVYPAELGSIMNISHTASQVCGQFVVVNPEGRVTLVHHSAREYLRRTNCGPFALDPAHANEEILSKCLAMLCDKSLRRKLQMLKVPRFLLYASTSWAAHLEESSPDSKQVLDALVRFFGGPYPLAWIQYLAMSGRLSELFGASRRLTSYVRNRKKADSDKSPMLQRPTDLSLLEAWAVDLMRLPTKFGRHLSESPALIYQCIPALSPASSIIHRKFGENPAATLSVSGLSNAEWDDCLARVSGGTGGALRVAASALYLAVASDEPRGSITIWETDLFEERRAFFLGEHIWALAFNNSGSLLACYASSRTHVWKVADWSLEISADNPMYGPREQRAIEFKFDENDSLMMVSDVRRVHRLHTRHSGQGPTAWEPLEQGLLDEPVVPEGMFIGAPSSVAFNSDCTQIAVAYYRFPLSVWTVNPPRMVARLMKKTKHGRIPVISDSGTHKIVWHPSGTYILGIFGQILKWSPEDDTYQEAKSETAVNPCRLACSPDGRVFVTSDIHGYIKIFDFSSMSLVYKLRSENYTAQILFSPDSLRLYDLRWSHCNIWEPSCLLRLADASSEHNSDTDNAAEDDFWSATGESLSTPPSFPASESHAESKPEIFAVSSGRGPNGLFIATANEAGSISVYDPAGKRQQEIDKTMSYIVDDILAWSPQYDRLAYILRNGATRVKSVAVDHAGERPVSTDVVYSEKLPPSGRWIIRQLLFDGTGGRLLVCGRDACKVLSLPDGVVLAERQLPHDDDKSEELKWHRHPSEPEHVLCFSARSVTIFSWSDLKPQISITLDLSNPACNAEDDDPLPVTIDAILDSYNPRFLLLRTLNLVHNRYRDGFCVLPTTHICARTPAPSTTTSTPTEHDTPTSSTAIEIKPIPLPPALTSIVAHAIGILPDGRLVFLDRALWVCTTGLPPTDTTTLTTENPKPDVRRHFFVPHDWVTKAGTATVQVAT